MFCFILEIGGAQTLTLISNLRITSDGMGYFGYNEPSHAYIAVISFDQLVKAAKERSRAFFDKLGLPSN